LNNVSSSPMRMHSDSAAQPQHHQHRHHQKKHKNEHHKHRNQPSRRVLHPTRSLSVPVINGSNDAVPSNAASLSADVQDYMISHTPEHKRYVFCFEMTYLRFEDK